MPKISRYNRDTKRIEWVDASEDEHAAWKARVAAGKSAGSKAPRKRRASGSGDTDTLEGPATASEAVHEAAAASGAKQGRKPSPGTGPLTPIITVLSRFGGVVLIRGSVTLTGNRHPMTPAEAMSIAAPALRILNKELGKRIKYVPKAGGEYSAEVERITMGVASWILRGVSQAFGVQILEAQGYTVRQGAPAGQQTAQQEPADMFTPEAPQAAPVPPQGDSGDESDLFAGSEPVGKSDAAAGSTGRSLEGFTPFPSRVTSAARPAGPPGAMLGVPDSVWNSVSPPEVGAAEVMG